MRKPYLPGCLLIVAALLGATACSTFRTFSAASGPANPPVLIDGRTEDWAGRLLSLSGEAVLVGFLNDDDSLFLVVIADSLGPGRQIAASGLTVWIDPLGGRKKTLGIRYPLIDALGGEKRPTPPGRGGDQAPLDAGRIPPSSGPPGGVPDGVGSGQPAMVGIIEAGSRDVRRVALQKSSGLEAALIPTRGMVVFEMRIPLAKSETHPWAIGAVPGAVVGIGLETAAAASEPGEKREGGPGGGGMGGPGGGRAGGMGGGGLGGGGGMGPGGGAGAGGGISPAPAGLKLWAKITLK